MKGLMLLIIAVISLVSCNKESVIKKLKEDKGCIERTILSVSAHSILKDDVALVNNLFFKNAINYTNLRYSRYLHDSVQTFYPPYAKFDSKSVLADQYTNGLIIFTGQINFVFKNDTINYIGGSVTSGTSLNAIPELNLWQLRKLFIDDVDKFDHQGEEYKNVCLNAEFGYYNINSGVSYADEVLVKAWKITGKNSLYPFAFYQDDNGKLILYDNGIRTFK